MNDDVESGVNEPRSEQLDADDAAIAALIESPTSETRAALNVAFAPRETPTKYGAERQETFDAAVAATNDAAFAACTAAALASGAVINIPPGVYPINKWVIDAEGLQHLVIEGDGAILLFPAAHASGISAGDPAVWIGNSSGEPNGANFLRRVELQGLSIVSDLNFSASTRINRRGLTLYGIQDINVSDVWIGGFNYQGLTLDTVYDSYFNEVTVYRSGRSQPTASDESAPDGNRWAIDIGSSMGDNSNALRFVSLRVEACPLMLRIDMPTGYSGPSVGPRQIDFFGAKLEQGQANQSEQPSVYFGWTTGIHFYGGGVVRNVYEIISNQKTPYTIGSSDRPAAADNGDYQKSITFHGTSFATSTRTAALWAEGHRMTFENCDFQLATSSGTSRPAFNLGDDCTLTGGTVTFASEIPSNPSAVPRTDFVRFFGKRSKVEGVNLYVPTGLPGSMLTVASTALLNRFDVASTLFGAFATGLTLEESSHLDNKVWVTPTNQSSGILPVGAPSVFNRFTGTLLTGTYTDFTDGSTGQLITLVAGTSQTPTLAHSAALRLRGNVSRTLDPTETVTFRRVSGLWAEV